MRGAEPASRPLGNYCFMCFRAWALPLALFLTPAWVLAQTPAGHRPIANAVKPAQPPVIDGFVQDDEWAGAPVAGGFVQFEPRRGEPASVRSEARVLVDATRPHLTK